MSRFVAPRPKYSAFNLLTIQIPSETVMDPKSRKRPVLDDEFEQELIDFVKKNRPRALTREERLDILLLQHHLRKSHQEKQQKVGPGRKVQSARATEEISKILHRKQQLVNEIWRDYCTSKEVVLANTASNTSKRPTIVPDLKKVTVKVQEYVRNSRKDRCRVVAKGVMDFLEQEGIISVDRSSSKTISSTLRSVQRFLKRKGYKRGKKKGCTSYALREVNQHKRDVYVSRMLDENSTPTRRVVYMDESYIHQHYSRHDDSLYDPSDEQDLQVKSQHKGQRYCFIGAIVDPEERTKRLSFKKPVRATVLRSALPISRDLCGRR